MKRRDMACMACGIDGEGEEHGVSAFGFALFHFDDLFLISFLVLCTWRRPTEGGIFLFDSNHFGSVHMGVFSFRDIISRTARIFL